MSLSFVKDHGEWFAFTPDPFPANFPPGVMFTKRASDPSDGSGWYGYKDTQFQADTLKMTVEPRGDVWIVQATSRDPSMLFPQGGMKVVEFDDGSSAPVEPDAYTGKVYDPLAHTVSDPPPAPPPVLVATPRQIRLALNQFGLRQAVEDYVAAADQNVKDNWEWATEFRRDKPMIEACIAALAPTLGKTEEEAELLTDQLFELAVTL